MSLLAHNMRMDRGDLRVFHHEVAPHTAFDKAQHIVALFGLRAFAQLRQPMRGARRQRPDIHLAIRRGRQVGAPQRRQPLRDFAPAGK
jgi:hypothetical protein